MRFLFKSAAKARAVFNPGTTREQAWDSLTKMFSDPHGPSLVGGSYSLQPIRQHGGSGAVTVDDIFKYTTHAASHYVRITAFNPFESFAYDEFWSPATGPDYDHPNTASDMKSTMEFRISDHPEFLVLDVRRTSKASLSFVLALFNFLNAQKVAFTVLSSVLGPQSHGATAWAGGWKRLPLDTNQAIVKPDRFNGLRLVEHV